MDTKHLRVLNSQGKTEGAVLFDDSVDFAKRIELTELLRQNEFKLVEITEEEYNTIPRKFEL